MRNFFSGSPVEASLEPRQEEIRSRSCWRRDSLSFVGGLDGLEDEGAGSASEGSLVVGFWKAIERKRTDSILAVGTNDKIWRLNRLIKGCWHKGRLKSVHRHGRERCVMPAHLGGHDLGGYISNEYCPRVSLIGGLVRRDIFFVLL